MRAGRSLPKEERVRFRPTTTRDEKAIQNFHKFSVVVWAIWLVPYFSPMLFGMAT
jgi:hypothetical protein